MKTEKERVDAIKNGEKHFLHHLSIDCVLFGYHEHQLKVLLLQWKHSGKWCLPGGFIKLDETLEESAQRILKERTGLDDIFLQQFQSFGEPKRSHRTKSDIDMLSAVYNSVISEDHWILKRTVSIGYYAVTEYSKVTPQPDLLSETCDWWDIDELPQLVFDHNLIVTEALKALRMQIYHQPIGYNLLPEKFTLPEIHALYETILGKELDRRNFAKKLISLGIIKKLDETRSIGAHRSPFLYKFDKRKYDKALKEGIALAF